MYLKLQTILHQLKPVLVPCSDYYYKKHFLYQFSKVFSTVTEAVLGVGFVPFPIVLDNLFKVLLALTYPSDSLINFFSSSPLVINIIGLAAELIKVRITPRKCRQYSTVP